MEISFKSRRLGKLFNSHDRLRRKYGGPLAEKIQVRLGVLKNAGSLAVVPTAPPIRRHLLRGDRQGTWAVDVGPRHRLIFAPNHDPIPRTAGGGIAVEQITSILILDVTDYH